MRRSVGLAFAMAGGLWLSACSEERPAATGRSMSEPAPPGSAAAARENRAPRIDRVVLDPYDPAPGTPVQVRVDVVDPDGGPVHLRYRWSAAGKQLAGAQSGSLIVPDLRKGTELEVTVTASDGRAESEPATAHAIVGNRAPAVVGVRLEPAGGVRVGEEIVAVADAEDPDGDDLELHYQWRVNEIVDERAGDRERLDTSALRRGDRVSVRVWASDRQDQSEWFTSPSLAVGNAAPEITSLPPPGMAEDGFYRYPVEARDPDGDRNLRFALAAAPEGARVDPLLGEIVWKPSLGQAGTHPIEVVVTDGHGGETRQRFEVTVREVVEKADAGQPPAAPAP